MRISDWSSDVCSSGHGGKEGQAERSIQGGAFSQGTAEVADLFLQGRLARVIGLELNLSLGRHWAEALGVSAEVKNAIQIIATRNILAAEIIWEVCARAFGSHPDFVALAHIDEQARLLVGEGTYRKHGPFIPRRQPYVKMWDNGR